MQRTAAIIDRDMNPVPTFDELMQPAFAALRSRRGSVAKQTILADVIHRLELPESVVNQPHGNRPGQTELGYRLSWALTYLKKVGLIHNPQRGQWELTPEGWTRETIDPQAIVQQVKAQRKKTGNETPKASPLDGPPEQDQPSGTAEPADELAARSLTPRMPTYTAARHFIRSLDGVPYTLFRDMMNAILEQRGSPQEQMDWTDPDVWIPQRLDGPVQKLALRLWKESQGSVNPRHVRGPWYLVNRHQFLARDAADVLHITPRGQAFLDEPEGEVVAGIDRAEGVLLLLQLVAEKGPGKRSDFLPEFTEFCHRETTARTDSVIKSALYDRLRNLLERGYIRRRGPRYEVTEEGLAYLQRYAQGVSESRERQADIRKLAQTLNKEAREQLNEYLLQMDPIRFEELIKLLLEEMGYDNVETTAPTNDKGVDVVADIELGISSVREVVQVKRRRGTVGRRILDQLRGSLHRFNAVRGTIITTGRFSRGTEQAAFEPGASPITLIDGEKLLDLLFEHNIGVARRAVEYYEFTPEKLAQFEGTEEITETGEMEA